MELKFQVQGQGQDLILLHGWGGSIKSLEPLAQALISKGYRAINIEWPGAGTSAVPVDPLQLEDYAQLLKKVVLKLNLTDPVALGHSFGGKVLLKTATTDPQLFSKLIIVNASGIKPRNSFKKKVFKGISSSAARLEKLPGISKISGSLRHAYYKFLVGEMDYYKAGPMRETFKNIIATDLDEQLNSITTPTLLIWGKDDRITPLWMGQRMHSLIPNSQLEVVEGKGHGLPLIAAEKVSELVSNYLHQ
jgi:pimeloyl-ACP methyl ester carboxylesterase